MTWVAPRTFVTDEFMTAAMFNTNVRDNIGQVWRRVSRGGPSNPSTPNGAWGTLLTIGPIAVDPGAPLRLELAAHQAVGGGILSIWHATDATELTRIWETTEVHSGGADGPEHEEVPTGSSVTWRVRGWGHGGTCTLNGLCWSLWQRGGP